MTFPADSSGLKAARNALAGTACLLLIAAGSAQASASVALAASGSAKQSLAQALGAAKKVGSVRITVQFFSGSTTGNVVQDSTLDSGKQTVAFDKELASVLLIKDSAYISGNDKGLTSYFGLPGAVVPAVTGHWVSLQSSDPGFGAATANVTLASALANVTPGGSLVVGKRSKLDHQWVRSISGEGPGGAGRLILFVGANKRSLPVEAVESSGSSTSAKGEIVKFVRWGEKVTVAAPLGAIPLATLEASSPASG